MITVTNNELEDDYLQYGWQRGKYTLVPFLGWGIFLFKVNICGGNKMEIEISGLSIGLFSIAIGLTLLGYFVGKGLQNFKHADKDYHIFIKENDLEMYFNLSQKEIEELLKKHPNIPKIELKGTTYYPYKQFMEWLSSDETYKKAI